MVLYRPRANTYKEAMGQVKLFPDTIAMDHYIIQYHNLYNLIQPGGGTSILSSDGRQIPDSRNGWLHSQYIYLGSTPLGIFDSVTLDRIPLPELVIENDFMEGLKCQFSLLDHTYMFLLGMDQWSNLTQCLGFNTKEMHRAVFRRDNVSIDHDTFIRLMHEFIMEKALHKVNVEDQSLQQITSPS